MSEMKCRCPIWAHGKVRGRTIRKSLETLNWEAGRNIVKEWEETGVERGGVTVTEACDKFYSYAQANGAKTATLGKYKLLFNELKAEFGKRAVDSLSVDELRGYRETWTVGQVTARGKIGRMRAFFKFCESSRWMTSNPASGLKLPKEVARIKVPYSAGEIEKILWATEIYPNQGIHGKSTGARLRAFILVLRYTGLRIRDAVGLRRSAVEDGKILLSMSKTDRSVWVPVPQTVVDALKNLSGEYYFWSGTGNIKSSVGDWQRALARIATLSGVHCHAHKFRMTFAIDLLNSGVSITNVAILLGNSVRVCEKHYLPFVKSRQIALTAEIEKAWKL
jgi:integrase